jgi:hypothetical protein
MTTVGVSPMEGSKRNANGACQRFDELGTTNRIPPHFTRIPRWHWQQKIKISQ